MGVFPDPGTSNETRTYSKGFVGRRTSRLALLEGTYPHTHTHIYTERRRGEGGKSHSSTGGSARIMHSQSRATLCTGTGQKAAIIDVRAKSPEPPTDSIRRNNERLSAISHEEPTARSFFCPDTAVRSRFSQRWILLSEASEARHLFTWLIRAIRRVYRDYHWTYSRREVGRNILRAATLALCGEQETRIRRCPPPLGLKGLKRSLRATSRRYVIRLKSGKPGRVQRAKTTSRTSYGQPRRAPPRRVLARTEKGSFPPASRNFRSQVHAY